MKNIKHYGSRAEIKRDVVTNRCSWMARNRNQIQSAIFNGWHANKVTIKTSHQTGSVRPKTSIGNNLWQVVDVRYMVDLGGFFLIFHECFQSLSYYLPCARKTLMPSAMLLIGLDSRHYLVDFAAIRHGQRGFDAAQEPSADA